MITGVKKVQLDLDMGNNKERARQQLRAQMEDSLDKREESRFADGQLSARVLGRWALCLVETCTCSSQWHSARRLSSMLRHIWFLLGTEQAD
jgi:hypothetical protein